MFNRKLFMIILALLAPSMLFAGGGGASTVASLNATGTSYGTICIVIFVIAYLLVMTEEITHLRKSKPVILAAGLIWIITSTVAAQKGELALLNTSLDHAVLEYGELFLFLLVAMTYINVLEEREVFNTLRAYLINKGLSYRGVFWLTGWLAFFISPIADNLTTSLVMCSVAMAIGRNNPRFVGLACVNIVVAANAGGAFSPFGDITTLMVWQKGLIKFHEFFVLFVPSLISYIIPAAIMHFAIPEESPEKMQDNTTMKRGAKTCILLFLCTIATAVSFENFFHLPPAVGMMTGLAYMQFFGYYIKKTEHSTENADHFDIFKKVSRAEWDTLLFFYGILLSVAGLATMGYLSMMSQEIYVNAPSIMPSLFNNITQANILVGILSAIVDNIPVMYAVLTMLPDMSHGQWLLVTLTAGIGGSLLSIGSAAGVAIMGQSRGLYTFFGHLKWIWAIAIGYFAGIACHLWINADSFNRALGS